MLEHRWLYLQEAQTRKDDGDLVVALCGEPSPATAPAVPFLHVLESPGTAHPDTVNLVA